MSALIAEKKATLASYGWIEGERDPRVKPEFPGAFMVAEDTFENDPEGWSIVGDDLDELIHEAYDALLSMVFD